METIFHEKQEGQLCAQHALNALLQGSYFTAVDLSMIANELDEEERKRMEEGGTDTQDYRDFMNSKSHNMDDSGFFSVQVIARALRGVWNLDMIPFNRRGDPVADCARCDPTTAKAFICNQQEHWFTIRKIGMQWFNLNSLFSGPELVSDTYLSLLLTQLQQEGYSIFVVAGVLPECQADQVLSTTRVTQVKKPSSKGTKTEAVRQVEEATVGVDGFTDEERQQYRRTIESSVRDREEEEKRQLELAMSLSMDTSQTKDEDIPDLNNMTEEEMLDAALKMSLQN